jgi:hypothetical protein
MEYIAEQELVIVQPDNSQRRVTIKIGTPRLGEFDGDKAWECPIQMKGLLDINKPARGMSSFDAIVVALRCARSLLRMETQGAKIFLVDNLRQVGRLYPEGGITVDEIFE